MAPSPPIVARPASGPVETRAEAASMKTALRFLAILSLAAAWRAGPVRAQDEESREPVGYVLYRVATAPVPPVFTGNVRTPVLLEADASGGRARAEIAFSDTCREQVEYTWKFDKDIRFLKAGETVTVTMSGNVGGDCGRDPFAIVTTGAISRDLAKTLGEAEGKELCGMVWAVPQTEAEARMHVKAEGVGSSVLKASPAVRNAPRVWFGIDLVAVSPMEGFTWQIAYLYQAVTKATEPGEATIQIDSPGGTSGTTAAIPPTAGSAAPAAPGGGDAPGVMVGPGAGGVAAALPPGGTVGPGGGGAPSNPPPGGAPQGGAMPPAPGGEAGPGRTLVAEERFVEMGETATVPVRLLHPDQVANINFEILFDPAVATATSVVRGSLLPDPVLFEANAGEPGRIRVGFAGATGLGASGIVALLSFEATGDPGDRTPLTLKATEVEDPDGRALAIALVPGEIIIAGPGGRAPGDLDGDGTVSAADALGALKMSVGLLPVDLVLDADGDRQVTSGDARSLLQRIR